MRSQLVDLLKLDTGRVPRRTSREARSITLVVPGFFQQEKKLNNSLGPVPNKPPLAAGTLPAVFALRPKQKTSLHLVHHDLSVLGAGLRHRNKIAVQFGH
jgi:hypothetical protein